MSNNAERDGMRPFTPLLVILMLILSGCTERVTDVLTASRSAQANSVTVVAGDGQAGAGGSVLPRKIVFEVRDGGGALLPRARGTFTVTAGGGTPSAATFRTNAAGVAAVYWTLGPSGPQALEAALTGGGSATATATAIPVGSQLTILRGDNAVGIPGDTLPGSIAVGLRDPSDNPIPNAIIEWSVTAGPSPGGVRAATRRTSAEGSASNRWVLGWDGAAQVLVARVPGIDSVQFHATVDVARYDFHIRVGNGQQGAPNTALASPLVIEVTDTAGNPVASVVGSFAVAAGGGSLSKATFTTNGNGRASVIWTLGAAGTQQVTATVGALGTLTFDAFLPVGSCPGGPGSIDLDGLALGETLRFSADDPGVARCLDYSDLTNDGQQFLILAEDAPLHGNTRSGFFPGTGPGGNFATTVSTGPAPSVATTAVRRPLSARAGFSWSTPHGPVDEYDGLLTAPHKPKIRRGAHYQAITAQTTYAVGDTILAYGTAIDTFPEGYYKAVVRHISAELVFAEDTRLRDSLVHRPDAPGEFNTPLTVPQMTAVAAAYSSYGAVQNDLLSASAQNAATELDDGKVIAIHSIMHSAGTWGYTSLFGNVFWYDYWLGTNGNTPNTTFSQNPDIIADRLFTHEIAHMRHGALLEDAGRTALAGNRWVVEGWAAFAERNAATHRLTGDPDFARTGNIVLGKYPSMTPAFYFNDVPEYRSIPESPFRGYGWSAYVFDYYADRVAEAAGDWRQEIRQFLVYGGVAADIDARIADNLPGVTLRELFTRARIALYADDYPGVSLPSRLQFLQFQLRASRPTSQPADDARTAWPTVVPGTSFLHTVTFGANARGEAYGYLVDGTAVSAASAAVFIDPAALPRGVISVTRLK